MTILISDLKNLDLDFIDGDLVLDPDGNLLGHEGWSDTANTSGQYDDCILVDFAWLPYSEETFEWSESLPVILVSRSGAVFKGLSEDLVIHKETEEISHWKYDAENFEELVNANR